jgi:hypothetical protein
VVLDDRILGHAHRSLNRRGRVMVMTVGEARRVISKAGQCKRALLNAR